MPAKNGFEMSGMSRPILCVFLSRKPRARWCKPCAGHWVRLKLSGATGGFQKKRARAAALQDASRNSESVGILIGLDYFTPSEHILPGTASRLADCFSFRSSLARNDRPQ